MKVSENFDLREFMHPTVWKVLGKLSKKLIAKELFVIMQELREDLNKPIVINNWHTGGRFKNRGLRLPFSRVGARRSQHKLGNAVDFHVIGMTPSQVVDFIKENENKYYNLGVGRIEDPYYTRTWIHIDVKKNSEKIHIFKP